MSAPAPDKTKIVPREDEIGIKADPLREYVAVGRQAWYAEYKQVLEHAIDDVARDFGNDVYERLLRDPQISSCVDTLKTAVLAGGLRINALELDDDAPENDAQLANTLADFCRRVIEDLETPIGDVLWNMLDAMSLGNKVAETTWIMSYVADDGPKLEVRRINVKPRESVAFVVDAFNNIVGILGQVPELPLPVLTGTYLLDDTTANVLPREKFFVFTFRPVDNDPRGSTLLRPLYNVWWIGQQLYPEWLKYLAQFATAILIGYTPEHAQPKIQENADGTPALDGDGNPITIYPEQAMAATLVQVRNGSVVTFKGGSKVDALKPGENGGEAFLQAFTQIDQWKAKAILHQTLATEEGQHQARAASEVHQDIFTLLVQSIKSALLLAFRRDVLKMLVRVNYGDEAVRFTPVASLGETEQEDFNSVANAISSLFSSNYIDPTQLPATDKKLGLPIRPPEAVQQLIDKIKLGHQMLEAGVTAAQNGDGGTNNGKERSKPLNTQGSTKPSGNGKSGE
jgi:hypothetical protein